MKKFFVLAAILSLSISARAFCEQPIIEEYDIKEKTVEKVTSKPQDGVEYEVQKALKAQAKYEDPESPAVDSADTASKTSKSATASSAEKSAKTAKTAAMSEDPVIIEKVSAPKKATTLPKTTASSSKKSLAVIPPKAEKRKMMEVDSEAASSAAAAGEVKEVKVSIKKDIKLAPSFDKNSREGSFRGGIIGPGIYAGNKSIDAMMGIGLEGEYFFMENLSAGLHVQVATNFESNAKPNAILSFIPQARYYFDFDSHPRLAAFVQAGAGYGLIDGNSVADIAIPGGGIEWLYNANLAIGFETSLHVLVRSTTAISVFAGPTFRYQF